MSWINRRRRDARDTDRATRQSNPQARSEDLVVEELGDELLVYDTRVNRAHSLNAIAVRVWRACDGRSDTDGLCRRLGLDAEAVTHALDELRDCELLDARPVLDTPLTRREATLKVTKVAGAAAAAPFIVSLAVPAVAAATVPISVCAGILSHGCGIACSPHDGSKCGCCCCQQTSTPPLVCQGDTKCCLPRASCEALVWGPNSNCSDISDCP